jgi:hypothetical protein
MRVTHEQDALNERVIARVAVLGVVVTAIGVWLAWQLQGLTERSLVAPAGFVAARQGSPPEDMNAIEMNMFREHTDAEHPSELPARLRDYGWSDRQRRTVHIPLNQALLLYLAGQRAAAAKTPTPSPGSSFGAARP